MTKSTQLLKSIKIQDEYGTSDDLLDNAIEKYKIYPRLDVCASDYNFKCDMYITKEKDALKLDWIFDFFMNPPYSKMYEFMKYAYEQHKKNNVNGLILAFSRTDTKWWHDFVEDKAELHFIKGRVKFLDYFGNLTNNVAPYASVWIIYRSKK